MPKIYKRILTPLFFAVVALVILCCSAFADNVTGIPSISINGGNNVPWISSITFTDGDVVDVNSSGIITFAVQIPSGVTVNINPNVIIESNLGSSSGFNVSGILNNYGNLYRIGVTNTNRLITINSGGVCNIYFGSITSDEYGNAINVNSGGYLNIFGGSITGNDYAVNNASGSIVNFYSGTVSGVSPFYSVDTVNVIDGNIVLEDGVATIKTNILGTISDLVSESITWLTNFIGAITSNYLLLAFVLVIFTGLGIGLLRRVKSI